MNKNNISAIKHSITALALMICCVSCQHHEDSYVNEPEPLNVEDFNGFRQDYKIKKSEPTMEEIALSMNFLRREDPLALMRYWVSEGFKGIWKGDDWINLFEGEGDYSPIAIEKIRNSQPLNVKVITWIRKSGAYSGSSYMIPYLRHEYTLQLEPEGWRKKNKIIKAGPSSNDRVYPYDARTLRPSVKAKKITDLASDFHSQ